MTTVNFTKPVTSDLRADVLTYIRNYMDGQAKLFDGDTLTSPPTNAIRYSAANSRFEKWNGSSWAALTLGFLPLAGGTMTGALAGAAGSFTSLTVGGNAVWHAGNLTPANYLPLAGGTLSGVVNTLNLLPTVNNASNLGSDTFRYAGAYATNFYEAGTALSAKYAAAGHAHDYLPLTGGTLSGSLTGTAGNFTTSLAVGGVAVSLTGHTHAYLPLGGGTLSGGLSGTTLSLSGVLSALSTIELGHASDTTLARIAAGRASVETREIVTLGFAASGARITRGTADPTGGVDGDFYAQYV